jgi:hypothetical protein
MRAYDQPVITVERAEGAIRDLEKLRDDLLKARDEEQGDPAAWAGRSRRWLQRLRGVRTLYALLLPAEHDPAAHALYDAVGALYALWEAYNEAVECEHGYIDEVSASVGRSRVTFERALGRARTLVAEGNA